MSDGPRGKLLHCGGSGCLRAPLVAVAVGVALVASTLSPSVVYAAKAEAPVQLASGGRPAIPAGQLGGPFTAASVRSAEEVLAHSGVATVADEKSKVALVAVSGPVRISFTRAQVQAMALSAADGGGILGSVLGSVSPAAKGLAPFSYVLASWVSSEATPAAEAVRALMGPQDWRRAPSLVFPTIALPLFVADVIAHTPARAGAPAKPSGALAEQAMGFFDAPCSTVSNFVQSTLVSVFNALQLTPATGGGAGAAIGNFFVTLWNHVVALAQQVVQGLINKVSQYVVSKIRLAAGAAVIIAHIVSYLNPWSVKVTGIPNPVEAGGIGMFSAKVDTGNGISAWPPALVDCLPAGVELPPLDAAHADATWSVAGAISATSPTSIKLSPLGQGRLDFATTAPSSGSSCTTPGPVPAPQTGSAPITVTRPGTDNLKSLDTNMIANGFGVAGSIVSPVLQSLLEPLLGPALSALDKLTNVIGTGHVTVTYPAPGAGHCTTTTGSTTTTPAAEALACPGAALVAYHLQLSYSVVGSVGEQAPILVMCYYQAPGDETTVPGGGSVCPNGDENFINQTPGGCQFVQVTEYTGSSPQSLTENSFCAAHGPCASEMSIPPSLVGGDAAYEITGPASDPAAIIILAVKDGFEVDVGVGWDANAERSEALIRALFAQHFGTGP